MKEVLEAIAAAGFKPDGLTDAKHFAVITTETYPLSGRNVDIPGRLRFRRPSDGLQVTVGKLTTFFYIWERRGYSYKHSAYFRTKELDAIRAYLAGPAEPGKQKEK